jgi:hypothetical protein
MLSDYFDELPDELLRVLAENTLAKMGGKMSSVYTPELKAYLERDLFSDITQSRYMVRQRRTIRSANGRHQDLRDSYNRVVGAGLVRPPPSVRLAWSAERLRGCWGYYISYARVLVINAALDTAGQTDALDSVMFHELLHAEECFTGHSKNHGPGFRAREEMFPRSLRAKMQLQSLNNSMRWNHLPRLGERITDYC